MRVYIAGVVLGAALAAAFWLYTYDTWHLVEYIGHDGRQFHPSERVREQPWWRVPTTVAVALIGGVASVWLLPERRRILRRFAAHFAIRPSKRPDEA
jgi:hypothetical protein